jgi:hypothetical protein
MVEANVKLLDFAIVSLGKNGSLLEGKLLQGGYRFEGSGDDWHLRKLDDAFASMIEPEWTGRSAISGKTLEEL